MCLPTTCFHVYEQSIIHDNEFHLSVPYCSFHALTFFSEKDDLYRKCK